MTESPLELTGKPLAEVVATFNRERFTGTLAAFAGGIQRFFLFVEGELRASRSSAEQEKLGSWLVRCGHFSEEQKGELLQDLKSSGAPSFGHLVVSRDLIDQVTLDSRLQELAVEIIKRAAAESTPEISYYEGHQGPLPWDTLPDLGTPQVVLEIAREQPNQRAKQEAVGAFDQVLLATKKLDDLYLEFSLRPNEAFLLSRLDGRRIETAAIAGTYPPQETEQLRQDPKELAEHQTVVDDITAVLGQLGRVETKPLSVLSLPNMAHLKTEIVADLDGDVGLEQLARALHPTAALGIAPRSAGIDLLRTLDGPVDRGRFGAPFGVEWPDGRAHCVVAIRNVQWNGADVMIGAVLVPGERPEKIVTEQMVMKMRSGSVIVDLAIDQGGCIETSRPTSIDDPTYNVHGVVHYCVPNLTSNMARTASRALADAALPYVSTIADLGLKTAVCEDPGIGAGTYLYQGKMVHEVTGEAFDIPASPIEDCLEGKARS